MKPIRLVLWGSIIFILLGLASCNGQNVPTATAVPQPTATSTNTHTPTPSPTETPSPTATATPTQTSTPSATNTKTPTPTKTPSPTSLPKAALDERVTVTSGGFSFQPAVGYEVEITNESIWGLVSLSGEADTILINILGVPDAEAYIVGKSDLELVDELVADFVENVGGSYEKGESYVMMVGEGEGTAVDLSGEMFDKPFIGQAIFINPMDNQSFFAIALARDPEIWATLGQPAFAMMLESVQFLPLAIGGDGDSGSAGPCIISTDPTYGTTEANPIQVGGDSFGGPPRERAYLDNLLGPNGETTNYERVGSLPYEDTILDIYSLTAGGTTTTLYLDEYNWSEPRAPLGFTCTAPFPLTSP